MRIYSFIPLLIPNERSTNVPEIDRFAPSRELVERRCLRTMNIVKTYRQINRDICPDECVQKKVYTTHVDSMFGLEPPQDENIWSHRYIQAWPCAPRRKRCLISTDCVLDLPNYLLTSSPNLIDWSDKNILVAGLDRRYYEWSWETQKLIQTGLTTHIIHSCKFDYSGQYLALGTFHRVLEIHDVEYPRRVTSNICPCKSSDCTRSTVDWSPTGNSFVTGCSKGAVASYEFKGTIITWKQFTCESISSAKVSPDARYVAICDLVGEYVKILNWPQLEPYVEITSHRHISNILTWHPWRSGLLAMSAVSTTARVFMWDVPTIRLRSVVHLGSNNHIDSVLFSDRTGELVTSIRAFDMESLSFRSRLIVMSDTSTVVDYYTDKKNELDRVRSMVFSPDGSKLAAATTNEDLMIWNFLPEDKSKRKRDKRRFCKLPAYLDTTTYGFSIR